MTRGRTDQQPNTTRTVTVANLRARVFTEFIAVLERYQVTYALLGRIDGYPQTIVSDVDFLVHDEDLAKMPALMQETAAIAGGRLVQCLQHEIGAAYYVIGVVTEGVVAFLPLDVSGSYRRKGTLWLDAAELLRERRRNAAGHPALAPAHAFAYYFIKRVSKCSLDAPRLAYLRGEFERDAGGAMRFLERTFGPAIGERARALLKQHEPSDGATLRALAELLERHAPREPLTSCARVRFAEWRRRWWRLRQPTGLVLGFLGPDGVGKSTLIHAVETALAPAFRQSAYFHLRPGLLIRRRAAARAAAADPHSQTPRGQLASIAKLGLLLAEYNAGWWVRIWPLTARSSLVIFDRYLHDMLADPLRYRWAGPAGLLKAASRLVPQPDLWIVLDAPAEVLQARKQEVSLDASQAQRDAYRRLAADLRGARLFDTSLDVQHCTAEICDYVLSHMRLRLHARLGLAIQDATP